MDRRWRIVELTVFGVVLGAIGLPPLSAGLAWAVISLLMFRRELRLALFPFGSYLRQCLSIRGLENDGPLQREFRRELGKSLMGLFPDRIPTACCCLFTTENGHLGVLTVHSLRGQFQIRAEAASPSEVTMALLKMLSHYRGKPQFQLSCRGLLPRCKDCSLRKAHRLVNRSYSSLIPRSEGSERAG